MFTFPFCLSDTVKEDVTTTVYRTKNMGIRESRKQIVQYITADELYNNFVSVEGKV